MIYKYKGREKEWRKEFRQTIQYKEYVKKYSQTKQCQKTSKAYMLLYREKHREELLAYRNTPERIERRRLYNINYRKTHKQVLSLKAKEHRNKHRVERRKNDVQYKLQLILRGRLRQAIKKNLKTGSAVRDLGCSILELKNYLEKQFKEGMTWENYGKNGWHIDHIKPVSIFDLTDRKQFLIAFHYTNLQPLWAKDNFLKSNKELF